MITRARFSVVTLFLVACLLVPPQWGAPPPAPPQPSDVVLFQIDLLRGELPALGLDADQVDWLLTRLDHLEAALGRGNNRNALHALGQITGSLESSAAPPHVLEIADVLGSMIVFETLVGPIPEAFAVEEPPGSVWQLTAWLSDEARREGADMLVAECEAVALDLLAAAAPKSSHGGGVGSLEISTADKRILKAFALDIWDDLTSSSDDEAESKSERKDAGLFDVGAKKADTPEARQVLRPRCEIDPAALAGDPDNFSTSILSMGFSIGYVWETKDWSAGLSGRLDVVEPFGPARGWRCGLDFELFKPGRYSVAGGFDVDSEGRVRGTASARIDF